MFIATIKRGVTSGKDGFFYPRDVSTACLAELSEPLIFQAEYGVPRNLVESGAVRLVRCGEKLGEIKVIETRYLEPEVHSLMEVDGYTVTQGDCRRLILLVSDSKTNLRGTYVGKYIEWGESKGWHKGPTCAARATETQEWYDLTKLDRPDIILPKIQQYRLMSFLNPDRLYQNCSLLGFYDVPPNLVRPFCATVNSTVAIVSRLMYARILGNEGNIQLDVYSAKMMLVPNVALCRDNRVLDKIVGAFDRMLQRKAMGFVSERRMRQMSFTKSGREETLAGLTDDSELDMPDRRELDHGVLEMMGVRSTKERDVLIDRLYEYLKQFFEQVRQKEEKAIGNKSKSKRKASITPSEIANRIYAEMKDNFGHLLHPFAVYVDLNKPYSTYDLPDDGVAELHKDMFAEHGSVRFVKGRKQLAIIQTREAAQAELIDLVANSGVRGLVRVPLDVQECRAVKRRYEALLEDRAKRIHDLIADRTADADLQETVFIATTHLVLRGA